MRTLPLHIAKDFMSKYSKTASISRYSPRASALAKKCSQVYPMEFGGFFILTTTDIIEACRALGIAIRIIPGINDALIAISAEQFNDWDPKGAFVVDLQCEHGPCSYSFKMNPSTNQPIKIPCCQRCANGIQPPTEHNVAAAKAWLLRGHGRPPSKLEQMHAKLRGDIDITPGGGAMILAAMELGYVITINLDGTYHIQKKKIEEGTT